MKKLFVVLTCIFSLIVSAQEEEPQVRRVIFDVDKMLYPSVGESDGYASEAGDALITGSYHDATFEFAKGLMENVVANVGLVNQTRTVINENGKEVIKYIGTLPDVLPETTMEILFVESPDGKTIIIHSGYSTAEKNKYSKAGKRAALTAYAE